MLTTHGRYVLYAAASCPFAHRVRLVRLLLGLEDSIHLSYVTGQTTADGFVFDTPEPVFGSMTLKAVYAAVAPDYQGRFSVPLLIDREAKVMVNNESLELAAMLAKTEESKSMIPEGAETLAREISDGVTSQLYKFILVPEPAAKEEVRRQLFLQLDHYEALLEKQTYVMGDQITLPDVVLWPSLIRYDNIYARQFGIVGRTVRQNYPALTRYIQRIWELPIRDGSSSVGQDVNLPEAVRMYWQSEVLSVPAGNDPSAPVPPVLSLF